MLKRLLVSTAMVATFLSTDATTAEAAATSTLQRFIPSETPPGFARTYVEDDVPLSFPFMKYFSAGPSWFSSRPNMSATRVRVWSFRKTTADSNRLAEARFRGGKSVTINGNDGVIEINNAFGYIEISTPYSYIEMAAYSKDMSDAFLTKIAASIKPEQGPFKPAFNMPIPTGTKKVFFGRANPKRRNWLFRLERSTSKLTISSSETSAVELESDIAFAGPSQRAVVRGKAAVRIGASLIWMESSTQSLAVSGVDVESEMVSRTAELLVPANQKEWDGFAPGTVQNTTSATSESPKPRDPLTASGKVGASTWTVTAQVLADGRRCYKFSLGSNPFIGTCAGSTPFVWRTEKIDGQLYAFAVAAPSVASIIVTDPSNQNELGKALATMGSDSQTYFVFPLLDAAKPGTELASIYGTSGELLGGPIVREYP